METSSFQGIEEVAMVDSGYPAAVVLALDGVILRNGTLIMDAYRACCDAVALPFDPAGGDPTGIPPRDYLRQQRNGQKIPVTALRDAERVFRERYATLRGRNDLVQPSVYALLEALTARGVRIAVVASGFDADGIVREIDFLQEAIVVDFGSVSASNASHTRYADVAQRLALPPADIAAVECTPVGLRDAVMQGMCAIAIADSRSADALIGIDTALRYADLAYLTAVKLRDAHLIWQQHLRALERKRETAAAQPPTTTPKRRRTRGAEEKED